VTWATAPVEFSPSSSRPKDATARGIPTFPKLGTKRSPKRPGAELEEKDFGGNEKGRQRCRPLRISQSTWRQLLPPPPFPLLELLIAK
jgi:hypothetical protein